MFEETNYNSLPEDAQLRIGRHVEKLFKQNREEGSLVKLLKRVKREELAKKVLERQ